MMFCITYYDADCVDRVKFADSMGDVLSIICELGNEGGNDNIKMWVPIDYNEKG